MLVARNTAVCLVVACMFAGMCMAVVSKPPTPLVPVTMDIPAADGAVIVKTASGAVVPSQVEREGDVLRVTWIRRGGDDSGYRLVRIADTRERTDPRGVKLTTDDSAVNVTIGGKLLTRYVFAGAPKPYCYPIIGPTGRPITRDFPMKEVEGETSDHRHHRSLWFTHGSVNGTDFWTESPTNGRIVHRKFEKLVSGPVYGRIVALNDWITSDGKKVCEDRCDIRIYRTSNGQTMDYEVTVKATEGPVTFGDTKEGTFGIRVADSMMVDRGNGHIVTSRGDRDKNAWARQAEWCDYYGPVDGETVGVAIMDLPGSFRYPTYWHVRTYGLFAANPFGLRDFKGDKSPDGSHTIPEDGEITFRYRIYIHKGTTEEAGVGEVFRLSSEPPTVTVAAG